MIPLFWTSNDVCPGFQIQGGTLACFLACVILRFTSGATPANSTATKPVFILVLTDVMTTMMMMMTVMIAVLHAITIIVAKVLRQMWLIAGLTRPSLG